MYCKATVECVLQKKVDSAKALSLIRECGWVIGKIVGRNDN